MGVVAPMQLDEALRARIEKEIIEPSVKGLQSGGLLYRGVLFVGIMVTPDGPTVLEYNCRFGDPETQVLLPLLDGDWGAVFRDLARGELKPLKWKNVQMACVVLASPGYPDSPEKGVAIEGDLGFQTPSSYFLHAGTVVGSDGGWRTNGGRVLNAIGMGGTREEALSAAYAQAEHGKWRGRQMRSDIGRSSLKN
jgi:phosphoribosylamine---glycine ligase